MNWRVNLKYNSFFFVVVILFAISPNTTTMMVSGKEIQRKKPFHQPSTSSSDAEGFKCSTFKHYYALLYFS